MSHEHDSGFTNFHRNHSGKSINHFPFRPNGPVKKVNIFFQIFPGDLSVGSILVTLVLGFAGFFLLVLLLTMFIVTLAREDQIVLSNDTVPLVEESECTENCDHHEESEIEVNAKLGQSFHSNNLPLRVLRTLFKPFLVPFQALKCIFKMKTLPENDYFEVI